MAVPRPIEALLRVQVYCHGGRRLHSAMARWNLRPLGGAAARVVQGARLVLLVATIRHSAQLCLALVAVAAIGLLDVITGPEIGLSIFYVLPIAAVGWGLGNREAVVIALAASASWLAADLHAMGVDHLAISAWNGITRIVLFTFVGVAMARLRRDRDRMEELARTDPLTELPNSRAFLERLGVELGRMQRRGGRFCIAYVDLDDFKRVNDRFGHDRGDELLREVARRIRECVRAGDLAARLGGDEFAVVLWDLDAEAAEAIGRRIVEQVAHLRSRFPRTDLGATVGIACFGSPPATTQEALRLADQSMYAAKAAGKGRVLVTGVRSPLAS